MKETPFLGKLPTFPAVVIQRHADAMSNSIDGKFTLEAKVNASISPEHQGWINLAPFFDQTCFATDVQGEITIIFVIFVNADGCAAFRFRRQITWLSPFKCFLDPAHAFLTCRFENQRP